MTRALSDKYGSSGTTYYDCSFDARVGKPCPDNCLKVIEEGIMAAPMCRSSGTTNLTSFEYEKRSLVSCLMVRGDKITTNTVLQSTVNKNGASSVDATTAPTLTPTPTTRPAATTAAPSANLATSTPSPTSSTSSLSMSLAAAVGGVVVAMVAV